jgi:hypothetical protein
MVEPPAWFKSFVYCEILFQLPCPLQVLWYVFGSVWRCPLQFLWHVFGSVWRCPLQFPWRKREKRRSVCFYSHLFVEGSCFIFYLYILTYTVVKHSFLIRWWSYRIMITRQVLQVEQELLYHFGTAYHFSDDVRLAQSSVFCIAFFEHWL